MFLILYPPFENSTTRIAIMYIATRRVRLEAREAGFLVLNEVSFNV